MKTLTTIMVGALALVTSSLSAHAAPNEKEEQFALEAASILMLGASNLDVCSVDTSRLMDMVDQAYEASGVKPTDYPAGEWSRKVFFHIAANPYYSAVLNHEPTSVASFCKLLREKIIPATSAQQPPAATPQLEPSLTPQRRALCEKALTSVMTSNSVAPQARDAMLELLRNGGCLVR